MSSYWFVKKPSTKYPQKFLIQTLFSECAANEKLARAWGRVRRQSELNSNKSVMKDQYLSTAINTYIS